jgi:DNA-binding transcriptional regulator YhcF (GntR family)
MPNKQKSQQKNKISPQLSKYFHNNAERILQSIRPSFLKVLNALVFFDNKYKNLYVSQERLAAHAGVARETCNRALKFFKSEGLVVMKYRYMRTSMYYLSPYFKNPDIRSRLSHIITVFKTFLITCIVANFASNQAKSNVTLFKNRYKESSISYSHSTKRIGDEVVSIVQSYKKTEQINPISRAIRDITCLDLTKWGQIKLSAFPDEAIKYAQDHFKYGKNIRDRFKYFYSLCHSYCLDNDIKPDWTHSNRLGTLFKIPSHPNLLRSNNPVFKKKEVYDKPSRPEVYEKTSHVERKIACPVSMEDRKRKEALERERYNNAVAHIQPRLKPSYDTTAAAKEFQRMLGLGE